MFRQCCYTYGIVGIFHVFIFVQIIRWILFLYGHKECIETMLVNVRLHLVLTKSCTVLEEWNICWYSWDFSRVNICTNDSMDVVFVWP
jgi:hypothetical protein